MDQQTAVHNTFVLERSYPVAPERVFAALSDPAKKRRWFGEGRAHDIESYDLDFRVGGAERLVYRFREGTPFPGVVIDNRITYADIVPNRRVTFTQVMDLGGKRISVTLVTIELLRVGSGTNLVCTHQGTFFEGADGPQMRQDGWKALFERLGDELGSHA